MVVRTQPDAPKQRLVCLGDVVERITAADHGINIFIVAERAFIAADLHALKGLYTCLGFVGAVYFDDGVMKSPFPAFV